MDDVGEFFVEVFLGVVEEKSAESTVQCRRSSLSPLLEEERDTHTHEETRMKGRGMQGRGMKMKRRGRKGRGRKGRGIAWASVSDEPIDCNIAWCTSGLTGPLFSCRGLS